MRQLAILMRKLGAATVPELVAKRIELQRLRGLTPTELTVLRRMAAGEHNRNIAQAMGIRLDTVKKHASEIYSRLRVDGRPGAIVLYTEWRGVIDPPTPTKVD